MSTIPFRKPPTPEQLLKLLTKTAANQGNNSYNQTAIDLGASSQNNNTSGTYAAAFGANNAVTGTTAFAVGSGNTASGDFSTSLGLENTASGRGSFAGGSGSTTNTDYSFVFGATNRNFGVNAGTIIGGERNILSASTPGGFSRQTIVGNGDGNTISDSDEALIAAASSDLIDGTCSAIVGGQNHFMDNTFSSAIIGGQSNIMSGANNILASVIVGGANCEVTNTSCFVSGAGVKATRWGEYARGASASQSGSSQYGVLSYFKAVAGSGVTEMTLDGTNSPVAANTFTVESNCAYLLEISAIINIADTTGFMLGNKGLVLNDIFDRDTTFGLTSGGALSPINPTVINAAGTIANNGTTIIPAASNGPTIFLSADTATNRMRLFASSVGANNQINRFSVQMRYTKLSF